VALPDRHAERARLYAATAGYDIVEEIGVDRIRANSVRQTELLASLLDEAGFEVVSPRKTERRGGSIVVRVPDAPTVHAQLETREIICDFRPDVGLRLGPHFFTTDQELELAVSAMREIVGRGATMHAPARSG
jgi:kynureninase